MKRFKTIVFLLAANVYSICWHAKNANTDDKIASFLELDLPVNNKTVITKNNDTRDGFNV